jgi:MFS family permease
VTYRFTGLWGNPDFLKLWTGQTVSVVGSQVTSLAIPLAAALTLDASPAQMGLLGAVGTLPYLVLGLPAGAWVDRLRRRPILIVADLGRALLLSTIPLAAALDRLTIEHLYVVGLLVGSLSVFYEVAYQSFLPSLVGRTQLVEGNSRLETSSSVARVAGPGLAGMLVQIFTAPAAILLDAISFLISGALLSTIHRTEPAPSGRVERRSIWTEIGEGLRAVRCHRLLLPLATSTAIGNFASGLISAVFVLFLTRTLSLTPFLIGLTYAAGSLGGVGGAVLATYAARRFGIGPAIIGGKALMAFSSLLIPLAGGPVAVSIALLIVSRFLGSGGAVVSNVNQVSLRQAITPDRLQGRVNATMRFINWGAIPLGALLGGVLGEAIGLRPTLYLSVVGMSLGLLCVVFSPVQAVQQTPVTREEREPASV